jgi:hypothetical protein
MSPQNLSESRRLYTDPTQVCPEVGELGHLQPFTAVFPPECMAQLACFGAKP